MKVLSFIALRLALLLSLGPLNAQTPSFDELATLGPGVATVRNPSAVALGDFDGDGQIDVAILTPDSVWLLAGTGRRSLGPAVKVVELPAMTIDLPQLLIAVDLNRDGKLDLIAGGSRGWAWVNKGDGSFGPPAELPLDNIVSARTADLNGDGIPDLIGLTHPYHPRPTFSTMR